MPGRKSPLVAGDEHRFGFQGQEMDDEVKNSQGTSYDFGARMYDPRVGRWLTIDPLAGKYPSLNPYNFVANSPIIFLDPDGKDIIIGNGIDKKGDIKFIAGSPAPDNLNEFQKSSWDALQSAIDGGRNSSIMEIVSNSDLLVEIRFGEKGHSALYMPNGKGQGIIGWDPETGMFSVSAPDKNTRVVYPDDPEARMSPEKTLEHELGHATNDLVEKTFKKDRKKNPVNPDMENLEEEKVITKIDQKHMKRENHYGIEMLNNSTPSSSDGELPEMEKNKDGSSSKYGLTYIIKKGEKMPVKAEETIKP